MSIQLVSLRFMIGLTACLSFGCTTQAASKGAASDGSGAAVSPDAACIGPSTATFLARGTARGLAVDEGFVYTASNAGVVRVPRAGGAVETLTAGESPVALAADDASLYVFSSHAVGAADPQGKVMSGLALFALPRAGGSARILVEGAYGTAMASDGNTLYWAAASGVQRLALAGGASTTTSLGHARVEGLALGRDAVFLAVSELGASGGPAVGSVRHMAKAGGEVAMIVDGLDHVTSIALDEDRVYFTDAGSFDGSGATVRSARLDGSGVTTIANAVSSSVAVDAHAVYYTTESAIVKVDKASGSSTVVATGVRSPGNLTVRGGNLYWTNAAGGVAFSEVDPPYGIMTACKFTQ